MEITFLVGNGFNTSLGLKTRYADFYQYLRQLMSNGNSNLKNNPIIRSIETHFINPEEKRWSDLELGLGEFTGNCNCQPEEFLEHKNEIDMLLYQYLDKEQMKFHADELCEEGLGKYASVFKNSLVKFVDFFPPDDKKVLSNVITSYREKVKYNIIDFNYTSIVDDIWDITAIKSEHNGKLSGNSETFPHFLGEKMHVHGELGFTPILGVDNLGQIANIEWRQTPSFSELLIKERMNIIAKQDRTNQAKRLINNSAIICVYGMSIGKTDQMWWQELANWLAVNNRHKLVIYAHCENRNALIQNVYEKRKIENKYWQRLRENISFDEKKWQSIRNSIFIQNSQLIFDFPETPETN